MLDRIGSIERGVLGDIIRRTASYEWMGRLSRYTDERILTTTQIVCDDQFDLTSCHEVTTESTELLRAESYGYDAVGNRTDKGANTTPGNRLESFDGFTMLYDDDGNLTRKYKSGFDQTFSWNSLGQLTAVTTNGATTTYGYDGLGRRVRKTVGGATTYFLYDGANLVMQLDGTGTPQFEFSYHPGVDNPHAVRRSSDGAVFYYVTEQPGHVTALVDLNNQVVNRYEYTPFGESITATEAPGLSQPFRFTGREFDSESGLYYYRARYYDPQLARFISEDPIGLAGGINPYAYVGNDPINHTDPTGLWCWRISARWGDRLLVDISVGSSCDGEEEAGERRSRGSSPFSTALESGFSKNFGTRGRDAHNATSDEPVKASFGVGANLLALGGEVVFSDKGITWEPSLVLGSWVGFGYNVHLYKGDVLSPYSATFSAAGKYGGVGLGVHPNGITVTQGIGFGSPLGATAPLP